MRDINVEYELSDLLAAPSKPSMRHSIRPIRSVRLDEPEPMPEQPAPKRVFKIKRPSDAPAPVRQPETHLAKSKTAFSDDRSKPDDRSAPSAQPGKSAQPAASAADHPAETAPESDIVMDDVAATKGTMRPQNSASGTTNANTVFTLKRAEAEPAIDTVDVEEEQTEVPFEPAASYPPPIVAELDMPRWHELTKIRTGSRMGKGPTLPVVDADRESTSVRAFDLLRTRLRQTTQERGWTNIAIASPTSGCGNTFTCVNLALSLSRVSGSRTVLMDMNLRNPGVAQALDMRPRGSMGDFLHGNAPIGDHMIRISETLALGLNNRADDNAAETLQAAETSHTLERMHAALQPELVIYDMPAMLAHDDVSAFLPNIDAVLLVSDGTKTMSRELMECERLLEGQVPLLGVVLNRARRNSIKQYS